ncbi:MAG TPA: FAD-dependent oxidoreductase [Gemmatimonadaceae bacterium]
MKQDTVAPAARSRASGADVLIVGGGLVGLSSAVALAKRQARVILLDHRLPGEASPAAAGMLAPGVERADGAAHRFAVAARDRYPSFVEELADATGMHVSLNRLGILALVLDAAGAEHARRNLAPGTEWIDAEQLRAMEPALGHATGAVLHPGDGAVDNVALVRALRACVANDPRITVLREGATAVDAGTTHACVATDAGHRYDAETVVLAAGAWSATLAGLPRPLPVSPVRGQMYSVEGAPLAHVTYGPHGYVVPRGDENTVVGATMENAGFDVATTPDGMARVEAAGAEIAPVLAHARVLHRWSGLRPVTPDFLPILGRDPEVPSLLYACGHSRNGILLGPLSGDVVAALALGETPGYDLTPFAIDRLLLEQ